MTILKLIFSAVLYGWAEQLVFRRWWRPRGKPVGTTPFNVGQLLYHLGMVLFFGWVVYPHVYLIPLAGVIEDVFFWVFHPTEKLTETSWINLKLGGFYVGKQWIPIIYLMGIGLTVFGWVCWAI